MCRSKINIKYLNLLISIVKLSMQNYEIRTLLIGNLFYWELIKFPYKNRCDFKH